MENVKRGKLKLKGVKVAASGHKKKSKKSKHKSREADPQETETQQQQTEQEVQVVMSDMTPAQRRHAEHRKKREQEEIEKIAGKTYRQRVEEMNQRLASLTEHHDIPRVSAAGNG